MSAASDIANVPPAPRRDVAAEALCRAAKGRSLEAFLWHELASEHDAHRLVQSLRKHVVCGTPAFETFLQSWYYDEQKHFAALAGLYSSTFGVPASAISDRLDRRQHDFAGVEPFLKSDWTFLCLLVFDEIVTARSYVADYPIYDALAETGFSNLIREIVRDEYSHFSDAIALLRVGSSGLNHGRWVREAKLAFMRRQSYSGTFVLDHIGVPDDALEAAEKIVIAHLVVP